MSDFDLPTSNSSAFPRKPLYVVAAIIHFEGTILAAKRLTGGDASLKWEFPGGKVEEDEAPEAALVREIDEELGLAIEVDNELGLYVTELGDKTIHLHCFTCRATTTELQLLDLSEVKWCSREELLTLDWALPDIPAVESLLSSS